MHTLRLACALLNELVVKSMPAQVGTRFVGIVMCAASYPCDDAIVAASLRRLARSSSEMGLSFRALCSAWV